MRKQGVVQADFTQQLRLVLVTPKVRQKLFLTSLVLLGVGLGAVFYFLPKFALLQQEYLAQQQLKEEYRSHQELLAMLPLYQRQLEALEQKVTLAQLLLPKEDALPDLLESLHQMAFLSGVQLTKFQWLTGVEHSFYRELPLQLEAEGNYYQLTQFLVKVVNSPRLMTLGNFQMQPTTDESIALSMVVSSYQSLQEPESSASVLTRATLAR